MADNLSLVEGPFKTFTVRRVRPQDVDRILQHVKDYFLRDEPTSKLCGYTEEYGEEFCYIVKHFISHNMSFWMEDNETGEVAALRSTFVHRKSEEAWWETVSMNSRPLRTLYQANQLVMEEGKLYERYGIEEYADFLVASCHPKYRNQGLSKELYRRSLILIKANGIKLAKSMFTSPFTRAAVKSLGFVELATVHYKDLKDKDGNFLFDEKERSQLDKEHFASLMVKQI